MSMTMRTPTRSDAPTPRPRRGWRDSIEPGVYRNHAISCPASRDERPGRRCAWAYQALVPGMRPGLTRAVTVRGSVTAARAERRRLQAAGRPVVVAAEPGPPAILTLDALAEQWMCTRAGVLAPYTLAPGGGRSAPADRTRARGPSGGPDHPQQV